MQVALEKEQGPYRSRIFSLSKEGGDPIYTPLFIPSVSSTVDRDWRRTVSALASSSATKGNPILISAFDVYSAKKLPKQLNAFQAIVLDSGGYEARKQHRPWSRPRFTRATSRVKADISVGFDGDGVKNFTIDRQFEDQLWALERVPEGSLRTLLLHLDTDYNTEKTTDLLQKHATQYDIIGLTEHSLGISFDQRVRRLHEFRLALDAHGIVRPIHVFGTDHPLSIVIYSLAGADMFDGLGWATEFIDAESLSRHDISHHVLCSRFGAFASQCGGMKDDATTRGLLLEWNLIELKTLLAEIKKSILNDDAQELFVRLRRHPFAQKAVDLLQEMTNGR